MENSFGNWVKRRRKALDITQYELARRVGCSGSLIFKIESDERRPSRQIAELLAHHLDIPPEKRALFLKVSRLEKGVDSLNGIAPLSGPESDSVSSAIRPNLPLPLTSLVGREHELRAIVQQIGDPACRLLTLTGPGGIGKTRLALETAHQLSDAFKAGACFVSLAGTSSSDYIVPAIADSLGFAFSGAVGLEVQLLNFLREKELLLILDNLEHLLNGIELLDRILEHAPGLKLLTTSREQLNLRAEWVFEVHGLPVPLNVDMENLESNSAAGLFFQRAKQAKIDFTVTTSDLPSITRICQLVEGLPLGLELAATWVRMMSLDEIAQEIEHSKDFLTTTVRDVPQRHRSIRAVFDHSWELLTNDEQRILRQLAVFSGGFTREAAEHVAGATLSQLSALVDKSLLRYTSAHAGWYDFHELIRQYVELQAQGNPEEHAQLHDRHADYFAAWLHQWESPLQGPQQQEILAQINLEIDNVRSAWNWMVTHRQTSNIQKSLASMFVLYDIRNWLLQGSTHFEQAVTALQIQELVNGDQDTNILLLGELMVCQGHLCWHLGKMQKARELIERGLQLLRPYRHRPMLAEAMLYASILEHSQGNFPIARKYAEECVSLNREQARVFGVGYSLGNLGMVCLMQGEHETALAYLQESVEVMRSIHHPRGSAINLARLAAAAMRLGRLAAAQGYLEESLEITRRLHDRWGIGNAFNYLGLLAQEQGNLERAEALIRDSVNLFVEDGDQIMLASTLADLGYILIDKNSDLEARQSFLQTLQVASQSQTRPAILHALAGIATLDARAGKNELAFELATYCHQHVSSSWRTKHHAEKLCIELRTKFSDQQVAAIQVQVSGKILEDLVKDVLITTF